VLLEWVSEIFPPHPFPKWERGLHNIEGGTKPLPEGEGTWSSETCFAFCKERKNLRGFDL